MKSLRREHRKSCECKRKHDNADDKNEVRLEKQLKSNAFDPANSNINLAVDGVDESGRFFNEYCEILLKDSNQSESSVPMEDDLLVDKNEELFNDIPRISLGVKLKNWAVKHVETVKSQVLDELLMILREEGYLDLPASGDALIADAKVPEQADNQRENETDSWIKKEESCESSWNNEENSTSQPLSHDEIEQRITSDVICPDFALTEFISEDNIKVNSQNSNAPSTKFCSVIKDELLRMEQRWARQLESTKRSLLYDMVRKYEDLKSRIGVSTRPLGTSFTEDKEILGVKLPILNVDAFCEFDGSIGDNPEKEIAMKSLMTTLCFGAASLSSSIGCILSAFLTKDVQMQYSACGKKIRGIKKRNFGDTNTFRYAKDVLREKHGTSDAEIISKTSRWFTGAGDRDGGRKDRKKQ